MKDKLLDLTAYLGIEGDKDYLEKKVDEIIAEFKALREKETGYKNDTKTLSKALFKLFMRK